MPPATSTDGPTTHTSDHVVIGGGVLGAATARALAARGERVLLLEQHDRGHVHGSSHGGSRIFRMGYPDADYVDLTLRAWDAWAALESASGRTLLDHTGAVDHGRPEVVDAIAAALDAAGIAVERLTPDEAAARWPGIAFEGHVLAHATAGRIRAADALEALLDLAAADGADLRFGVRVTDVQDAGDTVTLTLADGSTVRTRSVVAAVGAWAPTLVGALLAGRGASLPAIRVTQEQPAHFPSHLPDEAWPSFVHHPADGGGVYGLLTPGEGVKVGFHGTGPVVDPDDRDRTPDAAEVTRLQAYVERFVPGVDASQPTLISCLYDNSPDEDFVLDRRGPVTVATGSSGHGFKFAPVVGEMLADLATGGEPHPRFAL
ncbi:FAD-dependent oxidoreductase [Curtobacterium sp. MCPF17_047]|uniref:FAD-dependent oxidoreductase n=1 Tax=Curtobacterium sp. MCPF17_047 TaxID=2175654 RepID=UPI000DA93B8C|nr:FAD-dependent oxidoreductase [Curtobacterium sp. MCPF17_047]PZF66937.1 FAD-dependent oxidoreductase [Curtobacterium sp. MCPF17_047]